MHDDNDEHETPRPRHSREHIGQMRTLALDALRSGRRHVVSWASGYGRPCAVAGTVCLVSVTHVIVRFGTRDRNTTGVRLDQVTAIEPHGPTTDAAEGQS